MGVHCNSTCLGCAGNHRAIWGHRDVCGGGKQEKRRLRGGFLILPMKDLSSHYPKTLMDDLKTDNIERGFKMSFSSVGQRPIFPKLYYLSNRK